jgi:hypothetical protein
VISQAPGFQFRNIEQVEKVMTTVTLWASVNSDGTSNSKSSGVEVYRNGTGEYEIKFSTAFLDLPAIVGSQCGFDSFSEDTIDNVVFPVLSTMSAVALTGDSKGNKTDRGFSFIVIGNQ